MSEDSRNYSPRPAPAIGRKHFLKLALASLAGVALGWLGRGARAQSARRAYDEDRANRSPVNRTRRILRKDGEERVVEFSTYNRATGEIWLLNDVTKRKPAREQRSGKRRDTASSRS